jgi:hypothetical protein
MACAGCAIEEGGRLQELDGVAVVVGIIQKVGCPAGTKAKVGARGERASTLLFIRPHGFFTRK